MAGMYQYDKIIKYWVKATCTKPLHVGSGKGDQGQVLIHPVDGRPFVQAASIAGVFREYYVRANGFNEAEMLFGASNQEEGEGRKESRVRISDGIFSRDGEKIVLELRPRVKINPVTGVCDSSTVQGSDKKSGQKFEMEYVGAGAQITFFFYLFDASAEEKLLDVFSAIQQQQIQFGGQKSNGCGYLQIDRLLCKEFDMTNEQDRRLWMREEELGEKNYDDLTAKLEREIRNQNAYEIVVDGRTDGELLVKSIAVADCGKGAPDCTNIQNAKKDYIVPGSSFKGVIRNRMERIAEYLQVTEVIENTFGVAQSKEEQGKTGNIRFFDTVVGNQKDNDQNRLTHRIHIDKFTGGVMHRGLFTEKNVYGNVKFRIRILNRNSPDRTCGLLLFALRDLAVGMVNVGSGYHVGKGFIQVDRLTVKSGDGRKAEVLFDKNQINDNQGIIRQCMDAVGRK